MTDYDIASEGSSKVVTETFSTSFSSAITLMSKDIRQDIYNIYGLVRIADEIVDTYQGKDAGKLLNDLEADVYATLKIGFSANIIVHAFALTANKYNIGKDLIKPFFHSMRMDLTKKAYTQKEYREYIYGSAEVVGLMCLKVYVGGDQKEYKKLEKGASALGSAFQKVNFLRDVKDDYETRGRFYFPGLKLGDFNDSSKAEIIKDIEKDFKVAKASIAHLPKNSRFATALAYDYYQELLKELKKKSAAELLQRRISVSKATKLKLLAKAKLRAKH